MADITMCANADECPKAPGCYRATAIYGTRQSVALYYKPGKECDHYWPNTEKTQKKEE